MITKSNQLLYVTYYILIIKLRQVILKIKKDIQIIGTSFQTVEIILSTDISFYEGLNMKRWQWDEGKLQLAVKNQGWSYSCQQA